MSRGLEVLSEEGAPQVPEHLTDQNQATSKAEGSSPAAQGQNQEFCAEGPPSLPTPAPALGGNQAHPACLPIRWAQHRVTWSLVRAGTWGRMWLVRSTPENPRGVPQLWETWAPRPSAPSHSRVRGGGDSEAGASPAQHPFVHGRKVHHVGQHEEAQTGAPEHTEGAPHALSWPTFQWSLSYGPHRAPWCCMCSDAPPPEDEDWLPRGAGKGVPGKPQWQQDPGLFPFELGPLRQPRTGGSRHSP